MNTAKGPCLHPLQTPEAKPGYYIVRLAPVLELTYRSLNGLLERFHHSYFLYVLLSPDRFLTVEVYLVPVVAMLVALALQVKCLANCEYHHKCSTLTAPKSGVLDPAASVPHAGGGHAAGLAGSPL